MASARWENSSRIYEVKEAFAPLNDSKQKQKRKLLPLEHKRAAKTKIAAFEKKSDGKNPDRKANGEVDLAKQAKRKNGSGNNLERRCRRNAEKEVTKNGLPRHNIERNTRTHN